MNKPSFGFDGLNQFKPKPKPTKTPARKVESQQIDAIGQEMGFASRDGKVERRLKRKGVTKPVDQFNLRAHVEDINRFVHYADVTNKSYREVFEDLVKKLPKI